MARVVAESGIKIGIIAVSPENALKVANRLIDAGVKGILNFTPTTVNVPPGIILKNVDFSIDLEGIAFQLSNE